MLTAALVAILTGRAFFIDSSHPVLHPHSGFDFVMTEVVQLLDLLLPVRNRVQGGLRVHVLGQYCRHGAGAARRNLTLKVRSRLYQRRVLRPSF